MSLRAFTRINANTVFCVRLCAFTCVRLHACSRAGLIKTQTAFARKKWQNSNALWIQKFSGCTICIYITSALGHELSSRYVLVHVIIYAWTECIYIGF